MGNLSEGSNVEEKTWGIFSNCGCFAIIFVILFALIGIGISGMYNV